MHLVYSLAAGIQSAQNGTAELRARGSSEFIQYYADFEGNVPITAGTPVQLGSDGHAVVYVDELCDVVVKDTGGSQVRRFVAGSASGAVEVISSAFTGIDYGSSARGVSLPRVLQYILDLWKVVNGSIDWKILFNGQELPIPEAIANAANCYNVRNAAYNGGAQGDGVTDDLTAFQLAITAASDAGGGIVCIPPGNYLLSDGFTLPETVSLRGSGSGITKLLFDTPTAACVNLPGSDGTVRQYVEGLGLDFVGATSTFLLVRIQDPWVEFRDVVFNEAQLSAANKLVGEVGADTGTLYRALFDRCVFHLRNSSSGSVGGVDKSNATVEQSDMTFTRCRFVYQASTCGAPAIAAANLKVHGCEFDCSACAAWPASQVEIVDARYGGVATGNDFIEPEVTPTALMVAFLIPTKSSTDYFVEWGNRFGSGADPTLFVSCRPTAAGTAASLGTRTGRYLTTNGDDDATFDANFLDYETHTNERTDVGSQTIEMVMGPIGSRGTLILDNDSGSSLLFYWGANVTEVHHFEQLLDGERRAFQFEFYLDADTSTVKARLIGEVCCEIGYLRIEETAIGAGSTNHDYDIAAIWASMPADGFFECEVETFHSSSQPESEATRTLCVVQTVGGVLTTLVQDQYANANDAGGVVVSLDSGNLRVAMTNAESNIACAKSKVCIKRYCD